MTLDADWIVQSPSHQEYFSERSELPRSADCAKGSPLCDETFQRKICTVDSDCQDLGVSCKDFAPTIKRPGESANRLCLGSADGLVERVYNIMISADEHLDITSLSSPNGRFREAMINALAYLSHKENVPTVRFLYSGDSSTSLNFLSPADKTLKAIANDIQKRGGRSEALRMNLAWLSSPQLSWNHSKIIIADQKRVLSGGHNLWDADYLSEKPVFDLSMEVYGPVGQDTQKFVNTLWSKVGKGFASYPFRKDRLNIVPKSDAASGLPVIGVGRMGSLGNNAADDAIVDLIKASRQSIELSQQDLYSALGLKPAASWALPALLDAIMRGVKVSVLQSNPGPFLGYGMVSPEKTFQNMAAEFIKSAQAKRFHTPNGESLQQYFCDKVAYAPFRFSKDRTSWSDGSSISNHSKLIIVDQVSFYMGSQNFYPANLQEFGYIVNDPGATAELLVQYWNPLWEASESARLPCP
ncbi:MAG TPA: hypothetical protein VFO10_25775 [Oligoflexus sp.]|uniref:hypothetical protein n=1 Tax=Oligoflexus sp. TaxID=1971216 RepID=UPI002D8096FA|nr:hypothetical protein [Oligoflexus sp.]HET9240699.1 hypothetical protein [Oligoflexus sp.]